MMEDQSSIGITIMAAVSTLTLSQFSDLTDSISSLFHDHHRRLSCVLSSRTLFSLTLHHLHSLSFSQKSLLIARYLLCLLTQLIHFLHIKTTPPPHAMATMKLRDLDAVLLLLLLCELHQHDPEALKMSPQQWCAILCNYFSNTMLNLSGIGVSNGGALMNYIEVLEKCRRFVSSLCFRGGEGEEGREVAASVTVVVALPMVEVSELGIECVICKEETRKGRDVCELPCNHLFHLTCILPWLKKRNTCPCCRYQLPTDDVFGEIERLWEVLVKCSGSNLYGECLFNYVIT